MLLTASTLSCVAPFWGNDNSYTVVAAQDNSTRPYIYSSVYKNFKNKLEEKNNKSEKLLLEEKIEQEYEQMIEDLNEYYQKYIDLSVPDNKSFKSYMDARTIRDITSEQYKLKYEYVLDSETGIYMIEGRYACALGSFYSSEIGTEFDIVMKSGEIIPCVLADIKADEHTDILNQYTLSNNSIVEFVVHESTLIPNITNRWGNTGDVSTLGGAFEGEIDYIRIYEGE